MHGKRGALAVAQRLLTGAVVVVLVGIGLAVITQLIPSDGVHTFAVRFLPLLVPVAGLLELAAAGFAVTALVGARSAGDMRVVRRSAVTALVAAIVLFVLIPVEVFGAVLLASIVSSVTT